MLTRDGVDLVNGPDIANCLNDAFHGVFTVPRRGPLPDFPFRTEATCNPSDSFITEQAVYSILTNLNFRKSTGVDQVHPHVLKESAASFSAPLSSILRQSYNTSSLPDYWLKANVTPIYKKGKRSDPLNYRPISLTSVPCKIMEKLVKEVILEHFISNNLFTAAQHGFMRKKSCVTNLLEALDFLTDTLDANLLAIIVLFDFSKAFDVVPHLMLLWKLRAYGISGKLHAWIAAFLANRSQRVIMGDSKSDWKPVTSGVPQGSVLGPLLFLVYINDMPDVVQQLVKLFADDTKLLTRIENDTDFQLVQRDIDALVGWADKWHMSFNRSKCKVLRISKKSSPTDLHLPFTMTNLHQNEIHHLEESRSERDLGVQITHNLKWDEQVRIATAKANKALGTLTRTFKCWDLRMVKQLFSIYVRPHLEYAASVWNPYNQRHINKIERVQFRATRLVSSLKKLDYNQRLTELGLTTLEERRTRGDAIQLFKCTKGLNVVEWIHKWQTQNEHISPTYLLVQNYQLLQKQLRQTQVGRQE